MSDDPWLSIVGLGEDGPDGLDAASRAAVETATVVMGPPRHLALLGPTSGTHVPWPVPFADGLDLLDGYQGQTVAVLVSGDPFWFGAGTTLARRYPADQWRAYPAPSTFALVAARMGWALESTPCLGLHAAPLDRLRPHLAPGARLIVLLRDGGALAQLGAYLTGAGFGQSRLNAMSALGGPREATAPFRAEDAAPDLAHPVAVAITVDGRGAVMPVTAGRADDWFDHDGQITKRAVRAMTLSALAPQPGQHLWDIGGGSGSVAIEWLLAHPSLTATAFEMAPDRADRIAGNARRLGVDRLQVITGRAPDVLEDQPLPDTVFIGGGLSRALLDWLIARMAGGTRLVANAVTLESEALLTDARAARGGALMRIALSDAKPIGTKTGWAAAYPIVQWRTVL